MFKKLIGSDLPRPITCHEHIPQTTSIIAIPAAPYTIKSPVLDHISSFLSCDVSAESIVELKFKPVCQTQQHQNKEQITNYKLQMYMRHGLAILTTQLERPVVVILIACFSVVVVDGVVVWVLIVGVPVCVSLVLMLAAVGFVIVV